MSIPTAIRQKYDELCRLCDANPDFIPLPTAAAFLGCNVEGLRCAIERGSVPFGFYWQKPKIVPRGHHKGERAASDGQRSFKIPTLTFFQWVTGGEIRP